MVTIKFELNKDNIVKAGHTEQGLIDFLHRFYVDERKATEIGHLVYQRDDANAMCDLSDIATIMRYHPWFMDYFISCIWDVDEEVEDIIAEVKDYNRKYPLK